MDAGVTFLDTAEGEQCHCWRFEKEAPAQLTKCLLLCSLALWLACIVWGRAGFGALSALLRSVLISQSGLHAVYGFGKSEELVCDFIRRTPGSPAPFIATKFAPLPWRFSGDTVEKALQVHSLAGF